MDLGMHYDLEPVPALAAHLLAWTLVVALGIWRRIRGGGLGVAGAGAIGLLSICGAVVLQLLFVFAAQELWPHGRTMQRLELLCGAGHALAQVVLGLSLLRALWFPRAPSS